MSGTNQGPDDREVRSRHITVQFFTLIAKGVAPLDLCNQIAALSSGAEGENVVEIGRYQRDFWDLHRGKTYVRGQFRRWRMDEPPNAELTGAKRPVERLVGRIRRGDYAEFEICNRGSRCARGWQPLRGWARLAIRWLPKMPSRP
jgi:hypothetical protein